MFAVLAAMGAAVIAVLAAPSPARAESADQVVVTGIGLSQPLEVSAEHRPELCAALFREVSWLIGERSTSDEPDADELGPQYTLEAYVDGEARHRFHLYPQAKGGPRVFRPAEQPGERTAKEAWYHGRVSMSETLRAAGVPLEGGPGPQGAGGGQAAFDDEADEGDEPDRGVLGFLDDWREGMQLTVAVTLAMIVGLAGVALLIRRKV